LSSDALYKHRSNNAIPEILATPAVVQQGNVYFLPCIADLAVPGSQFWTTGGGLVIKDFDDGFTSFGGGNLFVRGGKASLTMTNLAANTAPVKVTSWRARTTINGNVLASPFVASQSWDPSLPDPAGAAVNADTYKFYKFWDSKEIILKPGETFERTTFIKAQKVEQTNFSSFISRDIWIIMLQNPMTNAAQNIETVHSHNISFTADRTN
jgi:hypothetical protein